MNHREDYIRYLLKAYTGRIATPEEEEALFQWVMLHPDDTLLKAHIRELASGDAGDIDKKVDWESLYNRILEKTNFRTPVRRLRRRLMVAAAFALLIGAGGLYFGQKAIRSPQKAPRVVSVTRDDVSPGKEKAVLKAGNARVVLNKQDTSFVLAGNTVQVSAGGLQIAEARPVEYTLEVPRGGEYSLTLADGTKVWLNAASTLRYPSVFNGTNREVWLEGEAYFQVYGKPEQPFIVHTSRQRIEVLGTEFNIQAYGDDKRSVTTLVQGKVSVESSGKSMILNPGEQALSDDEGAFSHATGVDIAGVTAWKNGYFRFNKAGIHTIMQELSRWYDVEVVYEPGPHGQLFGAMISRDNNLSEVLGMLEQTGDVHFRITGRKVEVLP